MPEANEVAVSMPLELPREMWKAVMSHHTTLVTDDEYHARLGWLLCAWDVLIEARQKGAPHA